MSLPCNPSQRLRESLLALALGFAISAIPFLAFLFDWNNVLLLRDLGRDFLAQKAFLADSIRQGNGIPLWISHMMGGMPFYAMNAIAPLHPLNLIFLLFSPANYPNALTFFLFLHYVLIFYSFYFFFRELRLCFWSAILCAIPCTFCGFVLSAYNVPHILGSYLAVPAFFSFFLHWLRSDRYASLYWASFFLAWPIFAGDPQYSYILALISLVRIWRAGWTKSRLIGFAVLGLLSLLCSSAQLLSTLDLAWHSQRGFTLLQPFEQEHFSFRPLYLVEWVFPHFFGFIFRSYAIQWTPHLASEIKVPFLFSHYLGTFVFFSAFLSLPFLNQKLKRHWRTCFLYMIAWLVALCICMGSYAPLPIYSILAKYFPLWGSFRYPERLLIWVFLPIFLGIAHYWKYNLRWNRLYSNSNRPPKILFLPSIIGILAILLAFALHMSGLVQNLNIFSSLCHFGIFLNLNVLIYFLFLRHHISQAICIGLLVIVSACDYSLASQTYIVPYPKSITLAENYPVARFVQEDMQRRSEKLRQGASRKFTNTNLHNMSYDENSSALRNFPPYVLVMLRMWDKISPNIGIYFGIEEATGYHTYTPDWKFEFWKKIGQTSKAKLFDILGIYYIPQRKTDNTIDLAINPSALPYAFLTKNIIWTKDHDSALAEILRPEFEVHKKILVESKRPEENSANATTSANENLVLDSALEIEKRNGKEFTVNLSPHGKLENAYFIWNESYDRFWRVFVNKKEYPIYRANAWAMAVPIASLAEGRIQLRFVYNNPLISYGQFLTLLWLLLPLGYGTYRRWKNQMAPL